MRHVDEGTLNAWLDDQIADPAEIAQLEEHLRACAVCTARLAGERATRDRAAALLGAVAPGTADRPPFEELVARAGSRRTKGSGSPVRGTWWVPASWAASVMLALGLGWAAHDLARQQAPEAAELRALRVEPPRDVMTEAAARDAIVQSQPDDAVGAGRVAPRPISTPPAVPAPPTPAQEASTAAGDAAMVAETDARRAAGAEAAPPAVAPSRAADASRPTDAPELPAAAPPAAPLLERRADTQARPEAFALEAVVPQAEVMGWRTVARTEAAARTGMALYGIDGLEPTLTAVSADGTAVRTLYVLAAGDSVELVQRRLEAELVTPTAPSDARLRAQVRREARVPVTPADGQTLAVTRGGIVVTLKAASVDRELESLADRLRVD